MIYVLQNDVRVNDGNLLSARDLKLYVKKHKCFSWYRCYIQQKRKYSQPSSFVDFFGYAVGKKLLGVEVGDFSFV